MDPASKWFQFTELSPVVNKNVPSDMCAVLSLKSASASAQSDQSLRFGATQNAPSKDSDQTAQMRSLIRIFAWRTCPKVRLYDVAAEIIPSFQNVFILTVYS